MERKGEEREGPNRVGHRPFLCVYAVRGSATRSRELRRRHLSKLLAPPLLTRGHFFFFVHYPSWYIKVNSVPC